MSLAVAEAVLCIIEEQNLQNNAKEVGGYLLQNFRDMMSRYSCIGDVRYVHNNINLYVKDSLGNHY